MNPLYNILVCAVKNNTLIDGNPEYGKFDNNIIIPIPKESSIEQFETHNDDVLYDTKELAGIAGMYNLLIENNDKIIYSNDLGSQIRGIDCIGKKDSTYLICEAKGTTRKKSTISQHLKNTKTKGRQMSWDWIWSSIVDFAEDCRNSKVFIEIFRNVIQNESIERIIFITRVKKLKGKYIILSTEKYSENEFNHLKNINTFTGKTKLNKWLNEIIKSGQQ